MAGFEDEARVLTSEGAASAGDRDASGLPDSAGLPDYARVPDPLDAPERYLLVVRRVEDGTFLLVRRAVRSDDGAFDGVLDGGDAAAGAPSMLSTAPPHRGEGLATGLASVVRTHLGVAMQGIPRVAETARPVRMMHPYTGGPGPGLLRAVALEAAGEPAVDALYASCVALAADEAESALSTDLERAVFRDGVGLFGER